MKSPETEQLLKESNAMDNQKRFDYPEKYKQARDQLLSYINESLATIAAMQKGWEMVSLHNGSRVAIDTEARSKQTIIDAHPEAQGAPVYVDEHKTGVSLLGDGVTSPYVLQAVQKDKDGKINTLEVTGTDPTLLNDDGSPVYSFMAYKTVAGSIKTMEQNNDGDIIHRAYTVYGDGHVNVPVLPPEGGYNYDDETAGMQRSEAWLSIEMTGLIGNQ